jgi:hypothetical protein
MPSTMIQSVGPPPERHADRIVAEMLRQLAVQRAKRFPAIAAAILGSRDGGPRAQRRMQERVERAGAIGTSLTPGKRGSYTLLFCDLTCSPRSRRGGRAIRANRSQLFPAG